MKLLRSSHSRPSWALTIVILAISLCRESLSMEDALQPLEKATSSDGGLAKDIAELSGKSVSEDKPSGPKRLDLQEKASKPVPMEIDQPSQADQQKIFDSQLHQTVMDQLQGTVAAEATNAVQIKIYHGERDAQKLMAQTIRDTNGINKLADKFMDLVDKKKHVAFIDNEADDLFMLLMLAYERKLPKHIITFGGFVYLRQAAVVTYLKALQKLFGLEDHEIPIVHVGLPYISRSARTERPGYDSTEGLGYIDPAERDELIARSKALEQEAKATKTPWLHEAFKPGMDVVRKMLDEDPEGTAITISTSPTQLAHVLNEKAERAENAHVVMTSPFMWQEQEGGKVIWKQTYNSLGASTGPMNVLLQSRIKYMGFGGGVSRSNGFRHLVDSLHGKLGSGVFPDVGVMGLETVIKKDSPTKALSILAWATENITGPKVVDWARDLEIYDAHMKKSPAEQAAVLAKNARAVKLLNWNAHQILETRRVVKNFGNDVFIVSAPADLYMTALLPSIRSNALKGGVGFEFTEPKAAGMLVNFHPKDGAETFAATDVNILTVRDLLQKIVQEVGVSSKTYSEEIEKGLVETMARKKAQAEAEAAEEAAKSQA